MVQIKSLFDMKTGDDLAPNLPGRLGIDPTNEERAAQDAAEAAYRRALDDIERSQRATCAAIWLWY